MKKLVFIFLCLWLLVACGSKAGDSTSPTEEVLSGEAGDKAVQPTVVVGRATATAVTVATEPPINPVATIPQIVVTSDWQKYEAPTLSVLMPPDWLTWSFPDGVMLASSEEVSTVGADALDKGALLGVVAGTMQQFGDQGLVDVAKSVGADFDFLAGLSVVDTKDFVMINEQPSAQVRYEGVGAQGFEMVVVLTAVRRDNFVVISSAATAKTLWPTLEPTITAVTESIIVKDPTGMPNPEAFQRTDLGIEGLFISVNLPTAWPKVVQGGNAYFASSDAFMASHKVRDLASGTAVLLQTQPITNVVPAGSSDPKVVLNASLADLQGVVPVTEARSLTVGGLPAATITVEVIDEGLPYKVSLTAVLAQDTLLTLSLVAREGYDQHLADWVDLVVPSLLVFTESTAVILPDDVAEGQTISLAIPAGGVGLFHFQGVAGKNLHLTIAPTTTALQMGILEGGNPVGLANFANSLTNWPIPHDGRYYVVLYKTDHTASQIAVTLERIP